MNLSRLDINSPHLNYELQLHLLLKSHVTTIEGQQHEKYFQFFRLVQVQNGCWI